MISVYMYARSVHVVMKYALDSLYDGNSELGITHVTMNVGYIVSLVL